LDLTLVPQRETGMTAYEMLLSESEERMLIVARAGREKEVVEIFNKWDLDAVVIGQVVGGGRQKIVHNGKVEADRPGDAVTDEAPKYNRPMAAKSEPPALAGGRIGFSTEVSLTDALKKLLASHNICSKHWVYEQYDSMVRTNTAILPGADAAV